MYNKTNVYNGSQNEIQAAWCIFKRYDAPAGKAKYDTTFLATICLQVFRVIPVHIRYPMVPAMPEWNGHATSYATPCKIFLV